MDKEKVSQTLSLMTGMKYYEWQSIERAVNIEFAAMSNRLELTDVSKIQKTIESEIIH